MVNAILPPFVDGAGGVDPSTPHRIVSRIADRADGRAIRFGSVVVTGGGDRLVRLPNGTPSPFAGIAVASQDAGGPDPFAVTAGAYQPGGMAAVLEAGATLVRVATVAVTNAPVYWNPFDGSLGTVPGAGLEVLPRAVFDTSALAGRLALLRLS